MLISGQCEEERTEEEFVKEEIIRADRNVRLNGFEDLAYFAAVQARNNCQQGCDELEAEVKIREQAVAALENELVSITGIKPPPPPCPCEQGNCVWERLAIFDYFVDLKSNQQLPELHIENLNGKVLSSSKEADVTYSPDKRFAVVKLPQVQFDDEAINIVIDSGDGPAKVMVKMMD